MSNKPTKEWIGPSEYARYRGVNLSTVKDWIKEGRIENCYKIGNNARKKINWLLADQALAGTSGSREKDSTSNEQAQNGNAVTLTKARTAKTTMEAKAAQLKFEMLSGSLVNKSEVIEVAKNMGRLTKESLMTLPDRLAPLLAGNKSIDEVHKILTEEIVTALRNLATGNFDFFTERDK